MGNKFAPLKKSEQGHSPDFNFYCLGCDCYHGVWTTSKNISDAIWLFNNNLEKPTLSPSLLNRFVTYKQDQEKNIIPTTIKNVVCHVFITDGIIQYLPDCTHHLAGQTIELPNIEEI